MATLTEAEDLRSHDDANERISIKATDCESNFSKSLRLMKSKGEEKHADFLRKLQAKFVDCTAYLGVFAAGSASLDQRLKRHPQYHDLVLLVLDMLNMNLLQTTADPDDAESDESSNDDVDRRNVELSGIQKSINELDRLAIYIRQSSTSSLDARVKTFGARKPTEISSFEMKAMLAVNGLYPEASESLRQRLVKSMTERYTRLLYWKFHDKKLRADRRRDGQPHYDRGQTQPKSTPSPSIEPAQRQRPMKDDASTISKPEASKVSKAITFLSETVPSNTGSNLIMPPAEDEMPVRKRASASTVLKSGAKFPSPPQFEDEEDRGPCPLCRKIFSKADFGEVRWWTHHVNDDLSPFACVSSTCSEAPTFASRSEWIAHMERDHGVFWSRSPVIPNRDGEKDPDPQVTSNLGQFADICPLCCLPLDEPTDARTSIHQPTAVPAMQTSNEQREQLPLDSGEEDSKILSASSKKAKKSVRFDVTKQDSELSGEGAGPLTTSMEAVKADESGTRKTTEIVTVMLNHLADHLQFLALITPRLSTEKLTVGDVQAFPSSQASSSDRAPEKRSTLDDELEFAQGDEVEEADKHGILQENLPTEAESTPELATPHRIEDRPRHEDIESATPIDWSLYSIPLRTTTQEDTVIERMQKVRAQCDRLLEAALDNLPDHDPNDKAYSTQMITFSPFSRLSQLEKAIGHEDLHDFFDRLFSSIDRGDDDILVDYCTEQVWGARPYQDPQLPTEERFASRRGLFAILVAHQTPSDILRFIKEGVSDLEIPLSASTLRQYLPTWAESSIDAFIQAQSQLLLPDKLAMEQATSTKHGVEPNPLDTTGLCLLSLDGGGVRGLSTLYTLKSIMDRLNHGRKAANLPPVKPCEVFDLIGGISTGGLIAIMLGRLERDVDECIAAYSDLAAAVFGDKLSSIPVNTKGDVKARFDSAKLESAIRKVVKQSGASEDDLFNDGTERGCMTFVCTADRHTKDIVRLRSYALPHAPNIRATICQAALATSATTAFFDPVSVGDRSFADGGLGTNNPVDEVEGEASNIWCSETGDLKPLVKCFISIGTGNPGKKVFEDGMAKFLSETVVQIATETRNTDERYIARWARHFDEKRYFRFNVEQGLQGIGLEEYKKKGEVEAATEGYLTHIAHKFRVRDCIQNLRLKQNKPETSFAALMNEYTIRTIRQQPAHQASWIVPFKRNPRFTGRETQLAQLDGMLFAEDRAVKVAITGLGGVGKTQLALELLFRTKEKHPGCSIIWIPATNMESLHQAYLDVARQLGIPGWDDDKADVKRQVQEYLGKESTGRWLLMFDNTDDIGMWIAKAGSGLQPGQELQRLVDYLPKSKQGAILFTTRDRKVAVKLAHQNVVEIPAMGEDAASQLLKKCLVDADLVNGQQDISVLLSQLTYLPLAIVQAAAYINENGIAIADYLSLLAEQEEDVVELFSEEFEDDGRYHDVKNAVATTWLISFEQIRVRDPLAADYLSFMGCVEPRGIPQTLLPPSVSRKREVEAIGTLTAYSFVTRRPVDMALDLHRLVHLATRNWLRKENLLASWIEKAIVRLEEVFPDHSHENRSLWRTYLPHVRFALESDLVDKDWKPRMNLISRYGLCLFEDGRWDEAEEPGVQVMEMRKKKLGADHPDTLSSMANLAETYRNQGRLDEAEELGVQVVEMRKKKLGADHPDTLSSMANLAETYRNQGRLDEAEELGVQVMEIRRRKLGADHPSTLTSMANLASVYRNQGRLDEAEELGVQVVETSKKKLGADHLSTLTSMANLASIYRNQGRLDEAEELGVQAMETSMKKLGADHPSTMTSMNNLAFTWKGQGRDMEAINLMTECVQRRQRILRVNHPHFISSSIALAEWKAEEASTAKTATQPPQP